MFRTTTCYPHMDKDLTLQRSYCDPDTFVQRVIVKARRGLDDRKDCSYASDGFSMPKGNYVRELPGLSLQHSSQISPTHSNIGIWNGKVQQYLPQEPLLSQGQNHGQHESYNLFPAQEMQTGHSHDHGSFSGSPKSRREAEVLVAPIESADMIRFPSHDSIGAHSQRTTNSFDTRSVRMYPSVSQMSYQMSSARSDVTGRSNSPDSVTLYTPTQPTELSAFESFPYPSAEDFSSVHPISDGGSIPMDAQTGTNISLNAGSSFHMFPSLGDETFVMVAPGLDNFSGQGPVPSNSIAYNHNALMDPVSMWENGVDFLESQRSSPTTQGNPWPLIEALHPSDRNSPLDCPPSMDGLSPRYEDEYSEFVDFTRYTVTTNRTTRKPIGPRPSKVASDLAAAASRKQQPLGSSEANESFKLGGRSSLEIDNTARDHPYYQNAVPDAEGFYHCPWEGNVTVNCMHKPEKLKCNYDKCVDSHLKPYRCRQPPCKDLTFSSTACLLRHEREAHAMHGHGDKPYLCTHPGCERGSSGNGFPRHWNLRDHMKRVHNFTEAGQAKSNASGSPPPQGPTKGKKRKASDNPESEVADKIPKVDPSTVVESKPLEPSPVELFHENRQKLEALLKQLTDPSRSDTKASLQDIHRCVQEMGQTLLQVQAGVPAVPVTIKQQSD